MIFAAGQQNANEYVCAEDFRELFLRDTDSLYQLAYLLTADHQTAGQAFLEGLEDSTCSNQVFKQWARSWAKRSIIQNAIRLVQPSPSALNSGTSACDQEKPSQASAGFFTLASVLQLSTFNRVVFVLTVLERYSDHDAALLLGCAAHVVRGARAGALETLAQLNFEPSTPIPEPLPETRPACSGHD